MRRPAFLTLIAGIIILFGKTQHLDAQVFYPDWKSAYSWQSEADSAPEVDPDKDGLTNLIEYAFGSNPLFNGDNDRRFLPAMIKDSASNPVFRFYRNWAFADIVYIVETTTDLKNWATVTKDQVEVIAEDGSWETCIVRTNLLEKARFYRVRVTGGDGTFIDSDGDGVPDFYERQPGRETYDPKEGIGTVITPNPFYPEADTYVPRGQSVDPGAPDVPTYAAVIDNTKSTLIQTVGYPRPTVETGYTLGAATCRSQSGGTAKIGNYEITVPANQTNPFKILTWENVLERDKIYPITLTDINGTDWTSNIAPNNCYEPKCPRTFSGIALVGICWFWGRLAALPSTFVSELLHSGRSCDGMEKPADFSAKNERVGRRDNTTPWLARSELFANGPKAATLEQDNWMAGKMGPTQCSSEIAIMTS